MLLNMISKNVGIITNSNWEVRIITNSDQKIRIIANSDQEYWKPDFPILGNQVSNWLDGEHTNVHIVEVQVDAKKTDITCDKVAGAFMDPTFLEMATHGDLQAPFDFIPSIK